jgi:hypothetical protein
MGRDAIRRQSTRSRLPKSCPDESTGCSGPWPCRVQARGDRIVFQSPVHQRFDSGASLGCRVIDNDARPGSICPSGSHVQYNPGLLDGGSPTCDGRAPAPHAPDSAEGSPNSLGDALPPRAGDSGDSLVGTFGRDGSLSRNNIGRCCDSSWHSRTRAESIPPAASWTCAWDRDRALLGEVIAVVVLGQFE